MSDLEAIRSELARIKGLEQKASDGPWEAEREAGVGYLIEGSIMVPDHYEEHHGDAAFIASARTDVPRLVRMLERALLYIDEAGHTSGKVDSDLLIEAADSALADIARLLKEE